MSSLRAELQGRGVLRLPRLLPVEQCRWIRQAYLEEVKPSGQPMLRQLSSRHEPHRLDAAGRVVNPIASPNQLAQFPRFRCTERRVMEHSELVPSVAAALGEPPALLQSAYYESSEGTDPHVDFNPLDRGAPMLGVWIALEDIGPRAGRFFAFPGSHRLPRDEDFRRFAELAWANYRAAFMHCEPAGAERQARQLWARIVETRELQPWSPALRAGDALIWDRAVVHGSHPPQPGGGTRHSLLLHFVELRGVQDRVCEIPGGSEPT